MATLRFPIRPLFLMAFGAMIVTEIVVLTPSSLDEGKTTSSPVEASSLILDKGPSLIPNLPKNRLAEYSVQKLDYVSVQNQEKQWKILADTAFLYNPEKLMHARTVWAELYDPAGNITLVTGTEGKYFVNQRDLEVFGNVKTRLPDGFIVYSDYMRYRPTEKRVEIPRQYRSRGFGTDSSGQKFYFESNGLDYDMLKSKILLHSKVKVTLERNRPLASPTPEASAAPVAEIEYTPGSVAKVEPSPSPVVPVPDVTVIESDHCEILRNKNLAHFTMNQNRPLSSRFVHITQPDLFTRGRRADLRYGDLNKVLQYLTTYGDVLIKEIPTKKISVSKEMNALEENSSKPKKRKKQKVLRYATSDQADFDSQNNVIILTQFPQVYEGEDTVTGDVIVMHRDSDLVEVEHSNAFSQGEQED